MTKDFINNLLSFNLDSIRSYKERKCFVLYRDKIEEMYNRNKDITIEIIIFNLGYDIGKKINTKQYNDSISTNEVDLELEVKTCHLIIRFFILQNVTNS